MLGAGSVPHHRETGQGTVLGAGSVPDHRETEMGQDTVLGAGSVPHHRERETGQGTVLGAGSVPHHRERWGRAQCLVLEVCLTAERDGAGHSAWCWKCA